jgi:flagellar protein FlaI
MSSGRNQSEKAGHSVQEGEETVGETAHEEGGPPAETATNHAVQAPDSTPDSGLSTIRQEIKPLLEDPKYNLLDEYWLEQPFSYAAIFRNVETEKQLYHVIEPKLSEAESELYQYLTHALKDQLLYRTDLSQTDDAEDVLEQEVRDEIDDHPALNPQPGEIAKVLYYLRRDLVGYERVHPFMYDPELEEISCNGAGIDNPIYVYHRDHDDLVTNIHFKEAEEGIEGDNELRAFVQKLAQRSGEDISTANPATGTALPDGSRIQLTLEEISPEGPTFTIRKFQEEPFTPIDLIQSGTFTAEQLAYLWVLVENGYSGLVSGGTGAGKTTTLNAIGLFIPPGQKVITIEDTREVKLPQENSVSLLTREPQVDDDVAGINMFDLLKSSLRMRPEYLIVGEVRGAEAKNLFQAMNTGHVSMATIHADSMRSALSRLENDPMNIPKNLISELGFVTIQTAVPEDDGDTIRRSKSIIEVTGYDSEADELHYKKTWTWGADKDMMIDESSSELFKKLRDEGVDPENARLERQRVLEYLADNGITGYHPVTTIIRAFQRAPEVVLAQIDQGEINFDRLDALEEQGLTDDA